MNNLTERWIRLHIAYDGTNYAGWQRQKNVVTVQQRVEESLAALLGDPPAILASSRTDAGVHALAQVASFPYRGTLPATAFVAEANRQLPDDIEVRSATIYGQRFSALHEATSKTYLYYFQTGMRSHPLLGRYSWLIGDRLDHEAMQVAARHLQGEHDFSSFTAVDCDKPSRVRTIYECEIEPASHFDSALHSSDRPGLRLRCTGNGFLKYMVRIIAGTLVEVGLTKRSADTLPSILESKQRNKAGRTAPAHALFLRSVHYDKLTQVPVDAFSLDQP